jgi:hypothetical protein
VIGGNRWAPIIWLLRGSSKAELMSDRSISVRHRKVRTLAVGLAANRGPREDSKPIAA